jgi:hypothetical protein
LNELKENQLKELEDQGIERLKELLDLNVSTIQEFYDFKLVVIYFEKLNFKLIEMLFYQMRFLSENQDSEDKFEFKLQTFMTKDL